MSFAIFDLFPLLSMTITFTFIVTTPELFLFIDVITKLVFRKTEITDLTDVEILREI